MAALRLDRICARARARGRPRAAASGPTRPIARWRRAKERVLVQGDAAAAPTRGGQGPQSRVRPRRKSGGRRRSSRGSLRRGAGLAVPGDANRRCGSRGKCGACLARETARGPVQRHGKARGDRGSRSVLGRRPGALRGDRGHQRSPALSPSHQEARLAAEIRPWQGSVVVDAAGLGAYRFIIGASSSRQVLDFSRRTLGKVMEHDEKRNGELISTLRAYLENRSSVSLAARVLGVHVHTVQYRLRRLEELTGLSLRTAEERLTLELAMRIPDLTGSGIR